MTVNSARSMNADVVQGSIDSTYISITPDRGNVENPPTERLSWPQYRNAEKWSESPHMESHLRRSVLPVERKTRYGSDPRF
jgi:hypothetical protein